MLPAWFSVLVASSLGYSVGASVPLLDGNPIHGDLSVHHVAKALRSAEQIGLNMKDLGK